MPVPTLMRLLVDVLPLATTPLISVFPVPANVTVRAVALLERLKLFEKVKVAPPDMLFVIVSLLIVFVAAALNWRLFVPVNVLLPPRTGILPIAFAPVGSVLAVMLTPLRLRKTPAPKAALLPRTNVPPFNVVSPVYVFVPLIVAVPL